MVTKIICKPALYAAVSIAAVVGSAAPATAQTSEAAADESVGGVPEIVVTAQRREQSVQDVPIAITALDAQSLETRGVTSALEIAQFVPNLVGINNTGLGTGNAYFLRGIANTESIATFDPPIGTYIDDIYISRQNANNFSFFDVERVEVLRGPQGTLFGRNTTGGAIAIVMKKPGDTVGGFVEAGYGSFDRFLARGSIDLPLSDTFAVKLSGYFQDDKGYARNVTTGERVNEDDGWGVRLGIRGDLSDTVRWNASLTHSYAASANLVNFTCNPVAPTECDGRYVSTGLSKDSNFTGLLTGRKAGFGLDNEAWLNLFTSNLEVEVTPDLTLNVITGFVNMEQDFALDFADGRALPSLAVPRPPVLGYRFGGFAIVNEGQHDQFTQEIKLNGSLGDGFIDFVSGIYFYKEWNTTDFADVFTLPLAPPPTGVPLVLADRTLKNSTTAWAGYLQADANVTDQIIVTAGIRYTDERKTIKFDDNRLSCNDAVIEATCLESANLIAANGVRIPTRQSAKVWTPRFAINFKPSRDLLLFVSATRGFKSGGWSARATSPTEALPFGPEKAWSYEAGIKADLFDRRLQLNLAAFWLDVSDLQTPSAFTRANGSAAFITRNFANYRNKGIELELTARPTDALTLFGSLGYSDDEYRLDADLPRFDLYGVESVASQLARCQAQLATGLTAGGSGADNASACGVGIVAPDGTLAEPVRSPRWTAAMGASYDAPLGGGLSLRPSVNASWRSKSEVSTANLTFYDRAYTSPRGTSYPANPFGDGAAITGSFSPARWIVNASLALVSDQGWSLTAECKNCLDQEAVESTLTNYTYLNRPRTWSIRGKYMF